MSAFHGLGGVLRDLRTDRRLTQEQLAERAGVSKSMLSLYEGGKQRPHLDTLGRLLDALGVRLGGLAARLGKVERPQSGEVGEPNAGRPSDFDLTPAAILRLADRCSWLRMARLNARAVETALQAIPQDGPFPDLHRSLLRDASDLGTQLERLLEEEGCPGREGGS